MLLHHRYSLRLVALLSALSALLTLQAAVVRGRVVENSAEAEPLVQASVRLLSAADSTLVRGAVTNADGRYRLEVARPGRYILEVSYVSYSTAFRNINVESADVNVPVIKLNISPVVLQEAVVTGIRTPITVKEDTVEFAAESYRTPPNAVVEDLLKRLPGVEVSSDGSITANGKTVSKILVDGKEFFSDDPKVASRNLPVDMVEKLQVVDRKSDLARLTGVDDGEEETVINLTVKKNRRNGWFGNAEAGYGTDGRYKANFTLNRFANGNQFTLLGAANNVNEPGFADMAAGRFRRFGGMNGINTTQSIGLNFNVGKEEILRLGGDVFYSHSSQDTRTSTDRRYLFEDSSSTVRSYKEAFDKSHNFRANFRLLWKPDSFNTLEFRPNFSLTLSRSNSADSSRTFAGNVDMSEVTRSLNREKVRGNDIRLGGRLIYNHNFRRRRGRSFSLSVNYSFSNTREKSDSYSLNRFFLLGDSIDLYDQYVDNHTWSNNVSARLSWTEPLGNVANGNFLTLAYRFAYRWNNADRLTYDRQTDPETAQVFNEALIFNPELSNRFRNDFMNQDIRLGFKHTSRRATLDVGVSLVPSMSKSINLINSAKNIPLRRVFNFAPYLTYRFRISKQRNLAVNYRGSSSQPSMTQLQPVADMSDPLRVVVGNPTLKPSFTHNARIRFHDFNSEAQRSIMLMADVDLTQNDIVSRTDFNSETGGQTTTYENVSGVWNGRLMNMVSLPLRNRAFTINNHVFLNFASTVGFNNGMRNRSNSFRINEAFGIAWRPENFELEIRPSYSFQTVHNSVQDRANRNVHTYGGTAYATYNAPFGLVLSSDLNYAATSGYSEGYDSRTWMWNASIGYQFLSGRNATISLKAYDILGQRSNIRRNVTANYIEDSRYNSVTRYVMATISYRFTTFASRSDMPEDRNSHRFPGPPPGAPRGGGRPMGPPPGM